MNALREEKLKRSRPDKSAPYLTYYLKNILNYEFGEWALESARFGAGTTKSGAAFFFRAAVFGNN